MFDKKIDWDAINQSLEKTRQVINETMTPSPDRIATQLRQRAEKLAIESSEVRDIKNSIRVIKFILGEEEYGIESTFVSGVYEALEIVPLPCIPKYVAGIINIHGKIICVINLNEFFGLSILSTTKLNRIIVLSHDGIEFGILVDAVTSIRIIDTTLMQTSFPTLTGVNANYLKGITKDQLIILDANKLIANRDLLINQEV